MKFCKSKIETLEVETDSILPPNLYNKFLIPELAPAETEARHSGCHSFLSHPKKGGRDVFIKRLVEAKIMIGDVEARKICIKRGLKLAKNF